MSTSNTHHVKDIHYGKQPLLEVQGLVKHFPLPRRWLERHPAAVRAVDDISFKVFPGETLGVVGESGCGKSTTARLLVQLIAQDQGAIIFNGQRVGSTVLPMRTFRRQVQMVFQDSYASLNPRLTIEASIAFGPQVHGVPRRQAVARARDLLARVGLDPLRFAGRYPHELSGGQRQRVNIARALALEPRLIILDEAVSALDKSVEAQVLNVLLDLKEDFGLTYIFISHDLNVVRYIADRVLVMYLGKVVELGATQALFSSPLHPYTDALLGSMPSMDPDARTQEARLFGDPPNPINPPSGCRFRTRCPFAEDVCSSYLPELHTAPSQLAQPPDAPLHLGACLRHQPGSGHSHSNAFNAPNLDTPNRLTNTPHHASIAGQEVT
jgi:peptide/nickel transport system ATP-binding protein